MEPTGQPESTSGKHSPQPESMMKLRALRRAIPSVLCMALLLAWGFLTFSGYYAWRSGAFIGLTPHTAAVALLFIVALMPWIFRPKRGLGRYWRVLSCCCVLIGLAHLGWNSPERQLRRTLKQTATMVVISNEFFIESKDRETHSFREIGRITSQESIQELASKLNYVEQPWVKIYYWSRGGDQQIELLDAQGNGIGHFDLINQGSALSRRFALRSDAYPSRLEPDHHLSFECRQLLRRMMLEAMDSSVSSTSLRIRMYDLSRIGGVEALERLAQMRTELNTADRAILAWWLRQPYTVCVEPLLELAKDSDPEVRSRAIYSLSDHLLDPRVIAAMPQLRAIVEADGLSTNTLSTEGRSQYPYVYDAEGQPQPRPEPWGNGWIASEPYWM